MHASVAVVAEYASETSGKLNVLSTFQAINLERRPLPTGLPVLYFVVQLTLENDELDREFPTEIRVRAPDGSQQLIGNGVVDVRSAALVAPGAAASSAIVVPVLNFPFNLVGDYVFELEVTGGPTVQASVTVLGPPPNTEAFRPEETGTPIVAGQFRLGDRVRKCSNGIAGTINAIYPGERGTLVRVMWDGEKWGNKTLPPTFTTLPLDQLCPEEDVEGNEQV